LNSDFVDVIKKNDFFILMDLSWHMTRSYHAFRELKYNVSGVPRCTGHIYGVLNTISNVRKKYPGAVIVLCADGKPVERQEILGEIGLKYKDGREKPEYNIYQDFENLVRMAFLTPGVYFAKHDERESDDIMFSLAKIIEKENGDAFIFIYSGDDDMLQTITDRTCVVRELNGKGFNIIDDSTLVKDDKFLEKYKGCIAKELPIYRAIIGDKSDGLPGVERFPKKFAAELAKRCDGNINYVLREAAGNKMFEALESSWDKVQRNYKLMKLECRDDFDVVRKEDDGFAEKVMKLVDMYGMSSYRKDIERLQLS